MYQTEAAPESENPSQRTLVLFFDTMKAIRVRVENGQITGDAPPGMPEGDVDLVLADDEDDMTEAELARLNDALERGFESLKAGRFRPARDVIADLRHRFR
jgi:hypothetical protein